MVPIFPDFGRFTNFHLGRVAGKYRDQFPLFDVNLFRQHMGICDDMESVGDHESRASKYRRRTTRLLKCADGNHSRLNFLDGVGQGIAVSRLANTGKRQQILRSQDRVILHISLRSKIA